MDFSATDKIKALLKIPGFTPEMRKFLLDDGFKEVSSNQYVTGFGASHQQLKIISNKGEFQIHIEFLGGVKPTQNIYQSTDFKSVKTKLTSFRPKQGWSYWK